MHYIRIIYQVTHCKYMKLNSMKQIVRCKPNTH